MNADNLKPCPFCGRKITQCGDYYPECGGTGTSFDFIECECGVEFREPSYNKNSGWNTRVDGSEKKTLPEITEDSICDCGHKKGEHDYIDGYGHSPCFLCSCIRFEVEEG